MVFMKMLCITLTDVYQKLKVKIMNEDKYFDDLENWELVAWMDEEFARETLGFTGDSADLTVLKFKGNFYNENGLLRQKNHE